MDAGALGAEKQIFEDLYVQTNCSYANARTVRNFFEKTIQRQADRLARDKAFTDKGLQTFTGEDFLRKTDAGIGAGKTAGRKYMKRIGLPFLYARRCYW
jgi:hypothetical protein